MKEDQNKNNKLKVIPKTTLKTKIKELLKGFTYEKVLAVIFVFLIFFIATATLPTAFKIVGTSFQGSELNLAGKMMSVVRNLDKTYSGMLGFKNNFINNKGTYVNLNGLMSRLMGRKEVNDVVLLKNGHLTRPGYYKHTLKTEVEQLTKLYNKQKEKNKDFLFVLAPSQVSKYEDLIPEELKEKEHTNYNGDKLIEGLKGNKVPYIDLREEMHKEGITQAEAFFKTDHHWNIETGFWAYTKIIDRLSKDKIISKVDKEFLDLKNYTVEIRKDVFLGSTGKRVGKYFTGIDDFPIITPKRDFNFEVELVEEKINKQGKFEEVLCDVNKLKKDYFVSSQYSYYTVADNQRNIINKDALENKKVLLIGDSFSNIPLPFLSLNFVTVHKRTMKHLKENFEQYYNKFNPDIVIVLFGERHIKAGLENRFFK